MKDAVLATTFSERTFTPTPSQNLPHPQENDPPNLSPTVLFTIGTPSTSHSTSRDLSAQDTTATSQNGNGVARNSSSDSIIVLAEGSDVTPPVQTAGVNPIFQRKIVTTERCVL